MIGIKQNILRIKNFESERNVKISISDIQSLIRKNFIFQSLCFNSVDIDLGNSHYEGMGLVEYKFILLQVIKAPMME